MTRQVPKYQIDNILSQKVKKDYCVAIPVLNEGEKIRSQLKKMFKIGIHKVADIIILDGGSKDNGVDVEFLKSVMVKSLLTIKSPGKQGAQFRMGFDYILENGYKGVVTIDGNNKDSVENIPDFINELESGSSFIQGSRFIKGGFHQNTPLLRLIAIRLIHAPWLSILSRFWWTDTTSSYRGMSSKILLDKRLDIFRDIFNSYELLFYCSAKIPRLGYKIKEIPVSRSYPKKGKTPTKIKFLDNFKIILELAKITFGFYGAKN